MANYLVINSKFQPFSFERYIQPYQMYGEAYKEVENTLGELATKANVWDEMANEQTDPYAYKMYKTYSNDLKEQANQLAREGLTPASRQNMLKMKQRYSSDIIPIEQAYKRRQELVDEQRKLLAQDNTLMFDRNASMLSLDDLIKNPQLTYQLYSGATLAKQVGTAAQNLAKKMRENPREWSSILHGQYFETMMRKGYTPEEIILASSNDPNAPKELKNIIEDAISSSNIASWGDQDILNRAYGYAREGLWHAIGDTQYQTLQNQDYLNPIQKLQKKKLEKELNEDPSENLYYRPVPKTTVDGDKKTTQLNADLQVLKEVLANPALLDKTSTRTVSEPNLINSDPMTNLLIDTGTGPTRQETYYPYREKLTELSKRYGNISYTLTDGVLTESNIGELAQKLENDIRSSAVRSFSYKPNITQSDLITQVIKENALSYNRMSNNTGLYELKNNKKGDAIDSDDLNSYFTSDSSIDFDPDLGFIINSIDSKGKTRSAIIDTELIDDPNRTFSKTQNSIKIALDNGEEEVATSLIEKLMKSFYYKYNTLEKRQSNTSSKIE